MSAPAIDSAITGSTEVIQQLYMTFSKYIKGAENAISDPYIDGQGNVWSSEVRGDATSVEQFITQPQPIYCQATLLTPEETAAFEQTLQAAMAVATPSAMPLETNDLPDGNTPFPETPLFTVEIRLDSPLKAGDYHIMFKIDPSILQNKRQDFHVITGGDGHVKITCSCSDGIVQFKMIGQEKTVRRSAPDPRGVIEGPTSLGLLGLSVVGIDSSNAYELNGDAQVRVEEPNP